MEMFIAIQFYPHGTHYHPLDYQRMPLGTICAFVDCLALGSEDRTTPMPTADDKELRISIRVPRATYEQIKKAAARDHRPMAGWVKALIANALDGENHADASPRARKR
jgi:hypothetical protein